MDLDLDDAMWNKFKDGWREKIDKFKQPNFQQYIQNLIDTNGASGGNGMLFTGDNFEDEGVYSLDFSYKVEEVGNEINNNLHKHVHIYHVCWQEEAGYIHNVCNSRGKDHAIYDLANNKWIKDVYLHDKYDDGSDGFLSDRIEDFFLKFPEPLNHEDHDGDL